MENRTIKSAQDPWFPACWALYESAFPVCERRDKAEAVRVLAHSAYTLEVWTDNQGLVGLIGWWDCGDLRFVEHYAIHPGRRSCGYGGRLLQAWMARSSLPVLLEIEVVTDETTQRRRAFYRRLGFSENPIAHRQPPYRPTEAPLPMTLMSYPAPIDTACYERFRHKQWTEIMPQ